MLSDYLFEFTRRLVPGQTPGSAIGTSFQLQANRALSSRFGATVGGRGSSPSVQLKYPDSIFSGKPVFSDVNLVFFSLDPQPLSNRNAMSHVLSLRARGSVDPLSSGIEQYIDPEASFPDPADILFEKHHPVDIASTTESCMYWSDTANSWSTQGCIVHYVNGTHTQCQCFHFSDFGIVMHETYADYDPVPIFQDSKSVALALRFKLFAITMSLTLAFGYALSLLLAKSFDNRANKKLLLKIRKDRVEKIKAIARPSSSETTSSDQKALDYIRIKAILRERFIFRYSNWLAEFTRQVKCEHVFAGIFFMPVGSAFTRPRRVSVLFLSFISNFSISSILLGSSVDSTTINIMQQALIAGICSALLSFPIYMMVSSLFRSIESDSLWMNQRAARVQKVKEDAALNLASSMLARSSSQAGPVRSSSAADDFVPPPPNQRPAFVRTAANSRPSALSRASQVMKSPNAALPDITSLTSAKLPAASAKVQRPRPSKSTLTAIASIHYLSRPSTASPASLRTQALNFSVPAPSGAAPAAAAIRTLGARLALKQATQKHTDIPAPSSGVPRPLLSPTLRRVLYSTSSIKSTSTSTFAPPPAGVPSHQRKRTSSRVGAYLPRRALPTISDTLRPSLMMQTEMELTEIGTKQAVSQGLRSKSLGQRVFDFLKARSLSMARKQLPPKFISVIYSVFGMVALILFYFGIIYGIRFTSAMEGAWAFAFIVALVQEFFIHQLVVAAVRASAVVLLQPLRSDKNEEQDNGQIPQSHQSFKNHRFRISRNPKIGL